MYMRRGIYVDRNIFTQRLENRSTLREEGRRERERERKYIYKFSRDKEINYSKDKNFSEEDLRSLENYGSRKR